jgi:hypothetical protein
MTPAAISSNSIKSLANKTMDKATQTAIENLWTEDRDLQNEAYNHIMQVTEKPVDWAYEAWIDVVKNLSHADNHNRAIAAQVLSNLAKNSDPKARILKDFNALLAVTKDERFVTARHCTQSIWKVGAAGKKQQKMVVDGLAIRFEECISEKNGTLIRYDILQSLRNLYDEVKDESVKAKALALIETEEDAKYRKKYATLWKK